MSYPLVSIIVITYNSSKYILETLESAKAQTYQNIELIVTDDCSTDNTVEICQTWIDSNRDMFVRTELVTANTNTGIAPNCNRGLRVAEGEWVKYIAGDDILAVNCISNFIEFVLLNNNISIVSSGIQMFGEQEETWFPDKNFINLSAKEQHRFLLKRGSIIQGSSVFINKKILDVLGGHDEKFAMVEDYPFFLKATGNGYRMFGLYKTCSLYRVHKNSLVHSKNNNLYNSFNSFLYTQHSKYTLREKMYLLFWHIKLRKWTEKKFFNKYIWVRKLLFFCISPYSIVQKINEFKRKWN